MTNETNPETQVIEPAVGPQAHEIVSYLTQALKQWEELPEAAAEFEISPPDQNISNEALRILVKLWSKTPRPYMIGLMEDGSIAIEARGKRPEGFMLVLDTDGSGHGWAKFQSRTWRKKYFHTREIPDPEIFTTISKLSPPTKQPA